MPRFDLATGNRLTSAANDADILLRSALQPDERAAVKLLLAAVQTLEALNADDPSLSPEKMERRARTLEVIGEQLKQTAGVRELGPEIAKGAGALREAGTEVEAIVGAMRKISRNLAQATKDYMVLLRGQGRLEQRESRGVRGLSGLRGFTWRT